MVAGNEIPESEVEEHVYATGVLAREHWLWLVQILMRILVIRSSTTVFVPVSDLLM